MEIAEDVVLEEHGDSPDGMLITIQCDQCDFVTISEEKLENHMEQAHRIPQEQSLMCSECSKVFTTGKRLQNHISKVHSSKDFECTECDQRFRNAALLNRHIAVVHENYRFDCDLCDIKLKSERYLERHKEQIHKVNKGRGFWIFTLLFICKIFIRK